MSKLFLGNREVSPAIFSDTSGERYAIKREVVDGTYKIPDNYEYASLTGIKIIDNNALRYAYNNASNNNHQFPDFSDIETINPYGMSYAFYNNSNATGIANFESLKTINSYGLNYTFYNCDGLTGLVDLSKVTYTNSQSLAYAFTNCDNITGFDMSSIKRLVNGSELQYTFQNCTSLTSVDLSNLLYSYSSSLRYTFQNCTSLTSADLSNLIVATGNYSIQGTFYGCTSLQSIDLGSLRYVSGNNNTYTFSGCTNLANVDLSKLNLIPATFTYTFQNCTSLTSLSFPHLIIQGINASVFNNMLSGVIGCTVHFPSNLQSTMESWTSVINGFGGTNTIILWDLPSYNDVDWSHTEYADSSTYEFVPSFRSTTATFDNVDISNLKTINNINCFSEKFSSCINKCFSVDLSSLKTISGNNYNACYYMFSNSWLNSIDLSNLETISGTGSHCYYMFQGCNYLTSIDLSSLETISGGSQTCQNMFSNCTNLSSVDLSNLKTINSNNNYSYNYTGMCSYMFSNCTSLTSLSLPSLSNVSGYYTFSNMFSGCTNLENVYFSSTINSDNCSYTFYKMFCNSGIKYIDIPLGTINGAYSLYNMFTDALSLESVNIINSDLNPTIISGNGACQYMFNFNSNNSSLTSVDFGDSVFISGNYACQYMFYNCTSLTSVDLSGIKEISGQYACQYMFPSNCTSLTSVDLSGLKKIDGYIAAGSMFRDNSYSNNYIQLVDLSSLENVSGYQVCSQMFYNNSSLTSVNLEKLSTFSNINTTNSQFQPIQNMFYNCTNLTNIKLDSLENFILSYKSGSTTYIEEPGEYIFYNCGITSNPLINTSVAYRLMNTFYNCTSLVDATFPKLTYIVGNSGGNNGFTPFPGTHSNVTRCDFPSLTRTRYANIFVDSFNTFTNSNFTDVRFPMLTIMNNNPFNQYSFRVNGSRRLTIHFRKDMQSIIEALSGYNNLWYASAIVFDQIGTITVNGNTYYRIGFCNKPGYIAWIKSDSNIIVNGITYTYNKDSISYFSKYSELTPNIRHGVKFYWKDLSDNLVGSHKIELENGDLVYSSDSVSDPDLTITTANIEIIYTSDSAEPDIGDSAYSDLGTTVIGTIDTVA